MSVPTHAQILRGAEQITEAMQARMEGRAVRTGVDFWTEGPWADWERLIPDVEAVRSGDADAVEHAIVFLEADPWCYRSGYAKAWLLLALRQPPLSAAQLARLDDVVLRLVRTGRSEFVAAVRYVHRRRGSGLKPALRTLVLDPDDAVAARALRLLLAARRPRLDTGGRARVASLLRHGSRHVLRMTDGEIHRTIEAVHGSAPT